jgi:ankyrin repeat protein
MGGKSSKKKTGGEIIRGNINERKTYKNLYEIKTYNGIDEVIYRSNLKLLVNTCFSNYDLSVRCTNPIFIKKYLELNGNNITFDDLKKLLDSPHNNAKHTHTNWIYEFVYQIILVLGQNIRFIPDQYQYLNRIIKSGNIDSTNAEGFTLSLFGYIDSANSMCIDSARSPRFGYVDSRNCVTFGRIDSRNLIPFGEINSRNSAPFGEINSNLSTTTSSTNITSEGSTALMLATFLGHLEIVKLLIENGADCKIQNQLGYTALIVAFIGDQDYDNFFPIINLLMYYDINIRDANQSTINLQTNDGVTALMLAANGGNLKGIDFLLVNGANIDLKDKIGDTALMISLYNSKVDVSKLLIEKGANCNIQNNVGESALMISISKNCHEISKLIIEKNANINLYTNAGKTALMYAAEKGNFELVDLLIKNGATLDYQNDDGDTALTIASKNNYLNVVNILIENKANVDITNKQSKRASTWLPQIIKYENYI